MHIIHELQLFGQSTHCSPGGHHVVNNQYMTPTKPGAIGQFKHIRHIIQPLPTVLVCLTGRIIFTAHNIVPQGQVRSTADAIRQTLTLVIATLPYTDRSQWHGDDSVDAFEKAFGSHLIRHQPSQIITDVGTVVVLFSSLGHPNFKIGWPYRSNHKVYVVPHPFQVSSPLPAWSEHECS